MKKRPEKAGAMLGQSIVEMVHLMYQNRTALWFLYGLLTVIIAAFANRRHLIDDQYFNEVIPKEWITKLKEELK